MGRRDKRRKRKKRQKRGRELVETTNKREAPPRAKFRDYSDAEKVRDGRSEGS